ncbi:MAG: hypothetical protein K6T65_09575 [Peptococcaceae bacterium]|nr:hypothetical protein [Peptococcaceae bacterium]
MSDQLLKEILGELKTLNQRVGHIESDVSGLKTDVSGLKTDVSGLKTDVSGLKTDVNDLKSGQARLEANQAKLEDGLSRLEANQDRLELRIENEVIDKIRALFDTRQVHEDKINLLIEGQEDMKTDLRYLVYRVVNLEKVAR